MYSIRVSTVYILYIFIFIYLYINIVFYIKYSIYIYILYYIYKILYIRVYIFIWLFNTSIIHKLFKIRLSSIDNRWSEDTKLTTFSELMINILLVLSSVTKIIGGGGNTDLWGRGLLQPHARMAATALLGGIGKIQIQIHTSILFKTLHIKF